MIRNKKFMKCEKCGKDYPSEYYFKAKSVYPECFEKLSNEEKKIAMNIPKMHTMTMTAFTIDGYKIVKNLGVVRGILVRSRSVFGTIGASLQTLIGGDITLFSELCEKTRSEAFDMILNHALEIGVNAVIGVRYDATEIMSGDSAKFYCQTSTVAARNHTLYLKGNLSSTGTIDFKTGSSPNNSLMALILDGSRNNILSVGQFVVEPSTVNEFHAITINKTGGARVILNSDIGMANLSSSVLSLINGIVETGPYAINVYSTSSGSVVGGSQSSYVYGKLGRGFPSEGAANAKLFQIGSAAKYRPAYFSNANSNYHLLTVEVVSGNANTGSSNLSADIDKVSVLRYYKVTAGVIPRVGLIPTDFNLTATGIGYYLNDGVAAGNTNLRVATSIDNRTNWIGRGPTDHTTSVGSVPTQIMSSAFSQLLPVGSAFYVALARATGSTENLLDTLVCKDISVTAGWNMLSVPVLAADMSKTTLFQTAVSSAYAYTSGYLVKDTLTNGIGYWLKFNAVDNFHICGKIVNTTTVPVKAGWNMIGIYNNDITVNQITSTPNGIVSSQFFGYNNGYQSASTLSIGKAYWVKASRDGVLNLP